MSLLPNLCNGEEVDRGLILWQMDLYRSLQRHYEKPLPYATNIAYNGPWKLLLDSITPIELFHLENDPHEVMNLLDKYPEIVNKLREETILFMSEPRNQ